MAHVISNLCTRCGACLSECPTGSIIEGKTQFLIDADTCDDHAACVNICAAGAISPRKLVARSPRASAEEEEEEEED